MEGSDETGCGKGRFPRPNPQLDIPNFNSGLAMRQLSPEASKRLGFPPSHPNNRHQQPPLWNLSSSGAGVHSRSLSQPAFFSLDSLPPLSPLTSYREGPTASSLSDPNSVDVKMEESVVNSHMRSPVTDGGGNPFWAGEGLPPRRGHRRSSSDVPLGFSAVIQSSPQLIPIGPRGSFDGKESFGGGVRPAQLMRQGSSGDNNICEVLGGKKSEGGEVVDDLFSAYMNMENVDKMNSPGVEDNKDLDSRASGSKNGGESSDNEVESGVNGKWGGFSSEKRDGAKRGAGGEAARSVRHCRSVSMDSYMDNLNFDDGMLKPLPMGGQAGQLSTDGGEDGNLAKFSMQFGSGEFNAIELKKIMESEKLSGIAVSDPKRAKRILANRQSAARSKERKMRYIVELEHKVQTLQTEATTLSAQVTKLQRDSMGLSSENNELKFRLQAMEQQAQLKDALNEALTGEVQRLRISAAELSGEGNISNNNRMSQQLSVNQQMLQLQQLNLHQMQHQQPQQQSQQQQMMQQQQSQQNRQPSSQQNGSASKHEPMQ